MTGQCCWSRRRLGVLVPGHYFIARGLGRTGSLAIPEDWDRDGAEYPQMLEFGEVGGLFARMTHYQGANIKRSAGKPTDRS